MNVGVDSPLDRRASSGTNLCPGNRVRYINWTESNVGSRRSSWCSSSPLVAFIEPSVSSAVLSKDRTGVSGSIVVTSRRSFCWSSGPPNGFAVDLHSRTRAAGPGRARGLPRPGSHHGCWRPRPRAAECKPRDRADVRSNCWLDPQPPHLKTVVESVWRSRTADSTTIAMPPDAAPRSSAGEMQLGPRRRGHAGARPASTRTGPAAQAARSHKGLQGPQLGPRRPPRRERVRLVVVTATTLWRKASWNRCGGAAERRIGVTRPPRPRWSLPQGGTDPAASQVEHGAPPRPQRAYVLGGPCRVRDDRHPVDLVWLPRPAGMMM